MALADALRDNGPNNAPVYKEAPACRVRSADSQGSPGIFKFDLEDYDTDGMHDAVNPSRITIQTAGKYNYGANIAWANGGTAFIEMQILKNGVDIINAVRDEFSTQIAQEVSGDFDFVVGDFIEVNTVDDGAGIAKGFAVDFYSLTFFAHRIG